jgi:hypothetical protein
VRRGEDINPFLTLHREMNRVGAASQRDGATPRAAHIKNKTDREGDNGCCPCS